MGVTRKLFLLGVVAGIAVLTKPTEASFHRAIAAKAKKEAGDGVLGWLSSKSASLVAGAAQVAAPRFAARTCCPRTLPQTRMAHAQPDAQPAAGLLAGWLGRTAAALISAAGLMRCRCALRLSAVFSFLTTAWPSW
eukprot:COSAG05_NODE_4696_length_1406_cov_1.558531_2_plen_136_part_00